MLFRDITVIGADFEAHPHQNLLIEGDRIVSVGEELPQGYAGEVYDGQNKLAVPGFFNTHCHVPMGLLRGYGEGLPLDRWLKERVFPFEDLIGEEDMYYGALLGIAEQLAGGVCSFTDMYMRMPSLLRAVGESGIKANLSHGMSCFDPNGTLESTNGFNGLRYLMEHCGEVANGRLIGDASIHAEYTSHPAVVREMAAYAKAQGLRMHLHLSETEKEHEECKARHGKTPAAYFEELGAFEIPTTAAHCVWLEGEDFDILARHGVTAVNCPTSNLKLGSGVAPVKRLLESGIRVAVGTDGASANNNLNMLEELHIASLVQKGFWRDPAFLSPAQLLRMATLSGAASQGRADCGCLKPGNKADVTIFDLDREHIQPVYDAATSLLYSAQGSDVCLTMVDGEVLYRDGEFKTIDIEKVKHAARAIRDDKLAQLARA